MSKPPIPDPRSTSATNWQNIVTRFLNDRGRKAFHVAVVGGGGGGIDESDTLTLIDANSYVTVQDEGTPLTQRNILNFIGANVTAADDAGNTRTNITISGGSSGYDRIQEEGTNLTQRATLNFIGSGVTAVDNSGSTRTDVTITTWLPGDIEGTGGIVGGVNAVGAGGGFGSIRAPFLYSGSPASGRNVPFDLPVGGWGFGACLAQGATDTTGARIQAGLAKNPTSSNALTLVDWQLVIPGLETGPNGFKGELRPPVRFEFGDCLNFWGQTSVSAPNSVYAGWSCEFVPDGGGNVLGFQSLNTAAFQSIFGSSAGGAGDVKHRSAWPAGTLKFFTGRLLAAAGGATAIVTVVKNGTPSSLLFSAGSTEAVGYFDSDRTTELTVAANDLISVQVTSSGTPAGCQISYLFVPTLADSVLVGWQVGEQPNGTTSYWMPFSRVNSTVETNVLFPVSRELNLTGSNCRLYLETALTGADTSTWTFRKWSGGAMVDSNVTVTLNSSTAAGIVTFSGSDTFPEGKPISLKQVSSGVSGFIADITAQFT